MGRVMIEFSQDELEALNRLAYAEYREVRDQMRHIIRQELERRGLLASLSEPVYLERAKPKQK